MLSFDSVSNIISLLDTIRDEINENYPELADKDWFRQLEHALSYLDSIKSVMSL